MGVCSLCLYRVGLPEVPRAVVVGRVGVGLKQQGQVQHSVAFHDFVCHWHSSIEQHHLTAS